MAQYGDDSMKDLVRGRRAYAWLVSALIAALAVSAGNYYSYSGVLSLATPAAERSAGEEERADLAARVAMQWEALPPSGELIRRFVLAIDRLAGQASAPPLLRAPGAFMVAPLSDGAVIHPDNEARYASYVASLTSLDAATLARTYRSFYPLMQRAYEELGFRGKEFHDRVIAAIDDLLAAPEIDRPLEVVAADSYYEFADPDLANRSPGQKLMMRIGAEHEVAVKRKLAELRGLLRADSAH